MKKPVIIILFALVVLGGLLVFFLGKNYLNRDNGGAVRVKQVTPAVKQNYNTAVTSTSIFIPYWSLSPDTRLVSEYDTVIYFGITPSYEGINKQDAGYGGINQFLSLVPPDKKKFLTLRMINDDVNRFVLENADAQEKIIQETWEIVEQNAFDGVVLDLEISTLFSKDVTAQINNFVQQFYSEASENYRQFFVTLYGDTFFKQRPYDLPFIVKNSDGIMVMAYDFHKSRGEPGPNFPYESGPALPAGRAKYQYDFKKMITEFSKFVPKEKLTVIFGMFGYDWLVDEKKRPIRQAEALSLNEINKKFIDRCEYKNCVVKRDALSKETEINYIISSPTPDEQEIYRIDYHIVWFEDEESVKFKSDYLREQGIKSISYWAYGYF